MGEAKNIYFTCLNRWTDCHEGSCNKNTVIYNPKVVTFFAVSQ